MLGLVSTDVEAKVLLMVLSMPSAAVDFLKVLVEICFASQCVLILRIHVMSPLSIHPLLSVQIMSSYMGCWDVCFVLCVVLVAILMFL